MNLIFIAALVAVCGAAKLDRTYLPPASAKTAGGAAGLQTPFAGNSFNDNSLPKGSFTNDFQGVVVDAAAAGTRASGEGETGLGGPRISYGSTDSRVGDAAFRGTAAAFRPGPGQNFNRNNGQTGQRFGSESGQTFNRQNEQNGQNFESQPGQNNNEQGQSFDAQRGQNQATDSDGQTASSQVQSAAQGFNRGQAYSQFQGNRGGPRFEPKERAQAAFERTAGILRFENEVGPESYHYAFETTNGIAAEENGVATNGVQAQGGFSYTGDDGQIYTVTYTADEGGYQPRGDHLPTPPPIPEEILKSLAKNAQDEAAGVIDDGSYDAQRYNAGGDYAESDGANVEHNDRQTPNFGKRPETDATASGTFINQNNQPFVGQSGQEDGSSEPRDGPSSNANRFNQGVQPTRNPSNNAYRPSDVTNGFRQPSQPERAPAPTDAFGPSNNFNQAAQPNRASSTNGFGSRKEYLPPVNGFNQNRRPQRPTATTQSNFGFNGISQASVVATNGQSPDIQGSLTSSPFRRPSSNRLDVSAQGSSSDNPAVNELESSPNPNTFAQAGQSNENSAQSLGSRNEYLPPSFGQSGRPQRLRPQSPTQSIDASAAPSFEAPSQATFQANEDGQSTSGLGFDGQTRQQANRFQQRPQLSQNRFSALGEQNQNTGVTEESQNSEISNTFESRPTSQPSTELTTPFESNEQTQNVEADSSAVLNGFGSDSPNKPLTSQFGLQSNAQSSFGSTRPQSAAGGSQIPFSSQGQGPFGQSSFNGNQVAAQNGLEQNEPEDAQISPSTAKPLFGQGQGIDQSYYYRQPSKPFSTPSSRFPGTSSGQFNRVTQQSAQNLPQFSGASSQNLPANQFQSQFNRGSTRFPQLPTSVPTTVTGSTDGQYQGSTASAQYNGITQASISPFQSQSSSRYPSPTISSAAPTVASQFNGITQATASSFSSAPSAPFGTRPTIQQSSFNQPESSPEPVQPFVQETEADVSQGSSQEVPTQQYNGEIYEYSKPPQGLPTSAQKEPATAPQRGQNFPTGSQSRPQYSSTQGNNGQEQTMQQPTRPNFGMRPPTAARPSRPQFGSFNRQGSRPQETSFQDSRPQFSAQSRPFAQSQDNQGPSGNRPKCCESLDNKLQSFRGTSQNNVAAAPGNQFTQSSNVGQGQFGTQFSGPTSQPDSQNFAGQGETFGGPREPPSFDQETGYHY